MLAWTGSQTAHSQGEGTGRTRPAGNKDWFFNLEVAGERKHIIQFAARSPKSVSCTKLYIPVELRYYEGPREIRLL